MTIEKKILNKLCKTHNITIEQGNEIFNKMGLFIKSAMEEATRNEDGTFDPDSFKVIHITNFGKIVPNYGKIKEINSKKIIKNNKQ